VDKPAKSEKKKSPSPTASPDLPGFPHSQGPIILGQIEGYSGPLPHPAILEKFDAVIPNGAERIMAMVESEQLHRHELEKKIVEQDENEAKSVRIAERRGQFLAAAVCLCLIFVAREIALAGHPGYATLLAGGTLAGIITAFVSGRRKASNQTSMDKKESD